MALRQDGSGSIVDPADTAEVAAWTRRVTEASAALAATRREAALLRGRLGALEAVAARHELEAARAARDAAREAVERARDDFDPADAAARRFEAVEVVDAETALDRATLAMSEALAELLREASVSASLTATVDGLALRERYRTATATTPPTWNHTTIPFPANPGDVVDPELALPVVDGPDGEYARLLGVLDGLDEQVDAVADLVAAESLHQLVQGNPTRAGGSLAVTARGQVPDEFEVVTTPRPGYDVTYRVVTLADATQPPAWTAARPGPATRIDPAAARWAADLLPDPAGAGVRVRFVDTDGAEAAPPVELRLSALGLDPLGWVRVASDPAELAFRITWAAAGPGSPVSLPAGEPVATWDQTEPVDAGGATLADLLAAARAAGRVLGRARALDAADLAHPAAPDVPAPAPTAVEGVAARVRAVETWTGELADALDAAADTTPDPAGQDALVGLLLEAATAGIAEAVPPPGVGPGPTQQDAALLTSLARSAAARLRTRRTGTPFTADPGDPEQSLARARRRAQELAGLRVPLPLDLPGPRWPQAAQDLGLVGGRLAGTSPAVVREWLLRHARVRPPVEAALAAFDVAETLEARAVLRPRVTQLPATDPDTWAGSVPRPAAGTASLIVLAGYDGDVPAAVCGLILDAFTQAVPAAEHDTGVSFHYDQPEAAPPPAVLVAVHPDPAGATTWDLDTLLDVVTSTFALARDRATAAENARLHGVEVHDG